MSKAINLLDRFRGCMVGAVVGDCLGSPVECKFWDGIPVQTVQKLFKDYQKEDQEILSYTDDTAMARQVADSIIGMKAVDSKNLAERYVREYFKEPHRGYGAGVVEVFKKLRKSECSDPFKPASEQFNGSGSYGNGAAMRVHPVGLFNAESGIEKLIQDATISSKVTHTHQDAINGAVLQAACVSWALKGTKTRDILKKSVELCTEFNDEENYLTKVKKIEELLEENDIENLIEALGNEVSALNSVPAAVYSFVAGAQSSVSWPSGIEQIENPFERTLQLAMLFGGDADTICSMTGAIAGAYYGESSIPSYMKRICEGVDNAIRQADQVHKLVAQ